MRRLPDCGPSEVSFHIGRPVSLLGHVRDVCRSSFHRHGVGRLRVVYLGRSGIHDFVLLTLGNSYSVQPLPLLCRKRAGIALYRQLWLSEGKYHPEPMSTSEKVQLIIGFAVFSPRATIRSGVSRFMGWRHVLLDAAEIYLFTMRQLFLPVESSA